ncbi:MAG: hypothetical protein AUG51_08590 [Acidobacteria bacterium 13_1_20CM_3_53_8]|nr:MAG: hypothetical protein AUG51_08590 [Acidobacteria bacterium 13_1_20CM_3_53_8]
MNTVSRERLTRRLIWLVIVCGGACLLISAARLNVATLDARFFLLALVTITLGSRMCVKIPRVRSEITVSETFIFLTMLTFDGEAAILLSAIEAFCTSTRSNKNRLYQLFNASAMALSYSITVWTLRLAFGSLPHLPLGTASATLVFAICVMASVQYITNSGLIATCVAVRSNRPIWHTWKDNFLYTSITYFAGASAAALLAKLIAEFGFYVIVAATPLITIVYFTYYFYLKNVEAKTAQVEQAERHVAELSCHIAEQKRIGDALSESEKRFRNAFERFRSAFDYAAIGMALVSEEGHWLQVNHSLCNILGYSENELLGCDFQEITHPDDLGTSQSSICQLLEGNVPTRQIEMRYIHKHGHIIWVSLSASLVNDAETNSRSLIFQVQDITERKRAEDQLLHDAFHDALTGLPNRALFTDHLKMALQRARRSHERLFATLFLDLDRFKVINDSLGHMIGDQLLVGIARRLEVCLRPGDTVARLGGDEFTILLEDLLDATDAIEIAERIQRELSVPFNIGGHEVFTTASLGIAPSSIGYERAEDILRDADTAMYRAKMMGKNRYEVFDKAMHDRAMNLLQMETDLRRAVDRQEFFLEYQPIVELKSGQVHGFEALVRWQHPERGMISPLDFIPVAEENGLIIPLGRWVLIEACKQLRLWQEQVPENPSFNLSVNLSSRQFSQPDLVEQIAAIIKETEVDARGLKLEITESMVMENIDTAVGMLTRLRSLGVEISLDDFGTGYSSLSYLHRFPINTLKIDRSFVSRMTDSSENAEIVRTIATLARSLEMDVVAEGIETERQFEQLRALNCEYGQGFLFSEPVAHNEAFKLLIEAINYPTHADLTINLNRQVLAA